MSIPPLPASIADECPPAAELDDNSLAELIRQDAELARLYNRCREKHWAAVEAYEAMRRPMPSGR